MTDKYRSCTEYWLDSEKLVMRGEFEQMYQDISDPWGCDENAFSRNNRLLLELLFGQGREYGRVVDIGCGLGSLTNQLSERNHNRGVSGIDVSETAIAKATSAYPDVEFRAADVLDRNSNPLESGHYDLIVMSEVLWYVLDDLEGVLGKVHGALAKDGLYGVHQYFPDTQRFGTDVVNGMDHFLDLLRRQFSIVDHLVAHQEHEEKGRVLLATFEAR